MDAEFAQFGQALGRQFRSGIERGLMGAIITALGTENLLEFAIEISWLRDCVGEDQFEEILSEFKRSPVTDWQGALRESAKKVLTSTPT